MSNLWNAEIRDIEVRAALEGMDMIRAHRPLTTPIRRTFEQPRRMTGSIRRQWS